MSPLILVVLQDIRKSFENVHLDVKIYLISHATLWNSTTVTTLTGKLLQTTQPFVKYLLNLLYTEWVVSLLSSLVFESWEKYTSHRKLQVNSIHTNPIVSLNFELDTVYLVYPVYMADNDYFIECLYWGWWLQRLRKLILKGPH